MIYPSLALCIPAYNAAAYLPRLLKSAQAQTIPFDEIWVYDDCSTDNTAEVAKQFEAKVIKGNINRGCSHGKNILADATTCEWIHFHDADDELYPNFVATAHKWTTLQYSPDVVLFDYEWREDDTNELISIRHFNDEQLKTDPISYAIREQINPFCGLYRRSAYLKAGGYDTDPLVLYNEDVAFHCRMAISGCQFSAESTITIINYRRGNSMSATNQIKCIQAHFQVMQKVANFVGDRYGKEIAEKLWGLAGISAAYLDWHTTNQSIKLALELSKEIPNRYSPILQILWLIDPYLSIWLREILIRLIKPQLRHNYPKIMDELKNYFDPRGKLNL
jgi:glycosyltransferase involved in cell wall biosynthesis